MKVQWQVKEHPEPQRRGSACGLQRPAFPSALWSACASSRVGRSFRI